MAVLMIVSLFTSRVVLDALGVDDYGIYNLVSSIIIFFGIFLGMLNDASLRFFSYELGNNGSKNISDYFSSSFMLHALLCIVVAVLALPLGVIFLDHKLIIPADRLTAAHWCYFYSVISYLFLILGYPFKALIISHEKMGVFSIVSILEGAIKLSFAFAILHAGTDRLVLHSILAVLAQFILTFIYAAYCWKNYPESRLHKVSDLSILKKISSFMGWSSIGSLTFFLNHQGANLLLGAFFNPAINAARGISAQVQTALETFVSNFQTAINPRLTKTQAENDTESLHYLVNISSRISYFLIFIPLIPIFFGTDTILSIWLKEVPQYTGIFVKITVVSLLFSVMKNPIETAIKATGQIKHFELCAVSICILSLPAAYVCFRFGLPPVALYFSILSFETLSYLVYIQEAQRSIGLKSGRYFKYVVTRVLLVSCTALVTPVVINLIVPDGLFRLLLHIVLSMSIAALSAFFLGLEKGERKWLLDSIKSRFQTQRQ